MFAKIAVLKVILHVSIFRDGINWKKSTDKKNLGNKVII